MAQLHQSLLTVSDIEKSRSFYENVIGLQPSTTEGRSTEYATGECTLVLEPDFPERVRQNFGLRNPTQSRGPGVIIAISVDTAEEVDEVFQRAGEHDSTIRMEPTEVSWGRYMMLLADPDDYTIEVSTEIV